MALALLLDDGAGRRAGPRAGARVPAGGGRPRRGARRAARAARGARRPALRGVHLLARRAPGRVGRGPGARSGARRDGALAAAPVARDVRRGTASVARARRASSRCTRPSRRSTRGPTPCPARCTSSASPTWRAPSTTSSQRLGRATEVVVYALSPCEGFWEDVDRARSRRRSSSGAGPGREHVRALNAIAGFDHDDRFVDPLGPQGAHAAPPAPERRAPPRAARAPRPIRPRRSPRTGASLVLEHASIRRECEAVASAIWRARCAEDESLRFDDDRGARAPGPTRRPTRRTCRRSSARPTSCRTRSSGLPPVEPGRVVRGDRAAPRAAPRASSRAASCCAWPCTRRSPAALGDVDTGAVARVVRRARRRARRRPRRPRGDVHRARHPQLGPGPAPPRARRLHGRRRERRAALPYRLGGDAYVPLRGGRRRAARRGVVRRARALARGGRDVRALARS